jgi:hypothetical protein
MVHFLDHARNFLIVELGLFEADTAGEVRDSETADCVEEAHRLDGGGDLVASALPEGLHLTRLRGSRV